MIFIFKKIESTCSAPMQYRYAKVCLTSYFLFIWQLEPTKECLTAVQKMNSCPACQGFPKLRPCSNYCINVMKGCLVFHIELQSMWDQFIGKYLHTFTYYYNMYLLFYFPDKKKEKKKSRTISLKIQISKCFAVKNPKKYP